jgi:predicted alpha/beta superfamily hydrolase
MYAEILNEERKIVVHLPLNYINEPVRKYPVMYVLDAGKLDFDISNRLFTLSSSGLAPECIVVGILNNKFKREENLTPPFMQTEPNDSLSQFGKADLFLKFITSELIPKIDSSYRNTNYRTLSGHSRAGLFVLYTLIEQSDLFDARFCYSTPAWRFDNLIIEQLKNSLLKNKPFEKSYLFFSVGADENPNIQASFHTMNNMLKTESKYLRYDSYLTPFANHQSNPVFSTAKALVSWNGYLKKEKIDCK